MELEGKIILDLGMQTGTSKAGNPWKKKEYVLETFGQFPRKVKFTIFGEQRCESMPIEVGQSYTLSVDAESREFNGRWYTDINCYGARPYGQAPQGNYPPQGGYQQTGGYPPAPQPYQQAAAPQPFGGNAFPPAPTPGADAQVFDNGGDNTDDLPF